MTRKEGYGVTAFILLLLVILLAISVSGCSTIHRVQDRYAKWAQDSAILTAEWKGYEPTRPVEQKDYIETAIPWKEREKIHKICQNEEACGCAFVGENFCHIVFIEGRTETYYHERHHCHVRRLKPDGTWIDFHGPNERTVSNYSCD